MHGIKRHDLTQSHDGRLKGLEGGPLTKPDALVSALETLLKNPIRFVPASGLTAEDERNVTLADGLRSATGEEIIPEQQDQASSSERNPISLARPMTATTMAISKGLINPGVMCYRNSIIQALLHVPRFVEWLGGHQSRGHQGSRCAVCAFQQLSVAYWCENHGHNEMQQKVRQLQATLRGSSIFARWRWNRQQDANEFFLYLVNAMLERHDDRSAIEALFGHRMARTTVCPLCKHESRVLSPYEYRLGVALQQGQALGETLRSNTFSSTQVRDYSCEKCKQRSAAVQHSCLTAVPEILELDFLRFERTAAGFYRKNSKIVRFGQDLNLSTYMETGDAAKYRLVSVVQHVGSFQTGHYRCIAKNASGIWEELDDSSVRKVEISAAINPEGSWTPYSLLFARTIKDRVSGGSPPDCESLENVEVTAYSLQSPKRGFTSDDTAQSKQNVPWPKKSKTVQQGEAGIP